MGNQGAENGQGGHEDAGCKVDYGPQQESGEGIYDRISALFLRAEHGGATKGKQTEWIVSDSPLGNLSKYA